MTYSKLSLRYDNTSTINLTKNPIQHLRSKHIEIRYYFIRNHVQNNDVIHEFIVYTDNQITDIVIKSLSEIKFCAIRKELRIYDTCS